ncbi:MAG: hypothetical protein WAT79_00140 [Saprospiraceae bacterium]
MKARVAKILMIIFLLSFSPFREFVKMPLVLVHFLQHQAETPDISFLEFFDMHYLQDVVMDKDAHQDKQLPFKTMQNCYMPVFVFRDESRIHTFFTPYGNQINVKIPTLNQFYYKNPGAASIFHPPKVA